MSAKVFFSYSHADEALRDRLEKHLSALKRQGFIATWHDRRIVAGDEFANEISEHLESADIILLLISPDFIASDYCYDLEMQHAVARSIKKEARTIPVILRPCDWHNTPFGKLQAAPRDGQAVTTWPNEDEAFLDIVKAIKDALPVNEIVNNDRAVTGQNANEIVKQHEHEEAPVRSSNLRLKKNFSELDHRDFLISTYEYIARFFENSIAELSDRNPAITCRFRRNNKNQFKVEIFLSGEARSGCRIELDGTGGNAITYSHGTQHSDNSYNDMLTVKNDDQQMYLSAMAAGFHGRHGNNLSQEGAAEYLWAQLIDPLQ